MEDVNFDVPQGHFLSIVGPSGCGKTSLLRCMAGLDQPSSGSIRFNNTQITSPSQGVTMVFQDYGNSLFPWKTVLGNVLFGMNRSTATKQQKIATAMGHLASVGLASHSRHHPWELSGGMQQRLAIARALASGAECLLMDEPFASLDAQTRADLEDLLLRIWADGERTVVFVTHDVDEAIYLSDSILVLGGSPTTVQRTVENTLARPRHQLETRANPLFSDLRTTIHGLLVSGTSQCA
ncbi:MULTISPECIES: ABC transporter ATP-binding protein [Pseudodesulfovibrio]|nr:MULTISPECIES: ABC transporter ATP-binding protein [Pseudodesulfovibrio]MCG2733094.1 ABC transporter ATP-binding protein [Pseudodesulfovibrio aespoeensis]